MKEPSVDPSQRYEFARSLTSNKFNHQTISHQHTFTRPLTNAKENKCFPKSWGT